MQHYNHSNRHICLRCNFRFNTWDDFLEHQSESENHAECEDCQVDFPSRAALRQHYVDDPSHHFCEDCGKHFGTQGNLTAVGILVDVTEVMVLAHPDLAFENTPATGYIMLRM